MPLKYNDQTETQIIDAVAQLPEVKLKKAEIERITKGKRHLKIIIYATPQEAQKDYYWVKVVEDNGTSLVTHFNFYVYPQNLKIRYYDIANDKIMNLKTWRKTKRKL